MSASLAALEQKFAVLDELPDSLYATVIVHPHGELLSRAAGVMQWRAALLEGQLPELKQLSWPEPEMCLVVLKRLEVLEIVQYCREQEELTDSVLLDICEGISTAEEYYHYKPGGFVDKLAQRQKIRDRDSPFEDEEGLADHVENGLPSDTDQTQADPNTDEAGQQTQPNLDEQLEDNSAQQQAGETQSGGVTEVAASLSQEPNAQDELETAEANNQVDPASQTAAPSHPASVDHDPQPSSTETGDQNKSESFTIDDSSALNPQQHVDEPAAPAFSSTLSSRQSEQDHEQGQGQETQAGVQMVDQLLQQRWQELAEHWHEMEAIFTAFSGHLGKGWDLTQGMLASQGWRDIIRYRKLVKNSAQLKALINTLGRFRDISGSAHQADSVEQIVTPLERMTAQPQEVITPRIVMETGGLDRSDELARQLPSELALLGHPKLKTLWHARRAERLLMSYAYRGLSVDSDLDQQQQHSDSEQATRRADLGLGPIIVCLDTSGSMQGEPEHIAKALVLEALIIASRENRACYVYSFGGPKQVIEHELNLSEGGLNRLLDFLQMSFHGGTDVTTPLFMAMQRQQQHAWQQADILLVSDGRFPAQAELYSRVKKMKQQQGLRLHGLLLGNWHSSAIEQICEPLHRFSDWQEIPAGLH